MSQNKPKKTRLDLAVFERGHTESREKARALIMAGAVYVNGQKQLKAGTNVTEDDVIEVRGEKMPYVSRGGLKLEKAMKTFGLRLDGCICADIGASTGGFTDCMLQNGASKVYAVDVGYGQLAWKLRSDERVINMERTNVRYVTPEQLGEQLDLSVIDVSFISLKIVLPVIKTFLKPTGQVLCLIKPQFEVPRDIAARANGVIRSSQWHDYSIKRVVDAFAEHGFTNCGVITSPVHGGSGNTEFLAYFNC